MTRQVPYYFNPRPYQREAWNRKLSYKYDIYLEIWHRQAGKDTNFIQFALINSWLNPGTQSAYVGLDNKWIRRNIWDKYINQRRHWDSYPSDKIDVHETKQQVKMLNNPEGKAEAMIQFIGFKDSETLIGSAYEHFFVSELSLYKRRAFDYLAPIWDNKKAMGEKFGFHANFTPRGLHNNAADMLRAYTGEDDPELWPGEHNVDGYSCYVDVLRADQSEISPGVRLYSDDALEKTRNRIIREDGNDNRFRQEFFCDFLTVNAGLVFQGIELLEREKRTESFNLRTEHPVYMVWDISSKDKKSDWTACIVFQYINEKLFIYDWFEDNRKSVLECVQELSKRPYFHLIKAAGLPWDADRSGSTLSPYDEVRKNFPGIDWHIIERNLKMDGINRGRQLLPNAYINLPQCDWLWTCFNSWEFKEIQANDDWSSEPKHDRFSHLMDAYRYLADMLAQYPYIKAGGSVIKEMPSHYAAWGQGVNDEIEDQWSKMPPAMRPSRSDPRRKKSPIDIYGEIKPDYQKQSIADVLKENGYQ